MEKKDTDSSKKAPNIKVYLQSDLALIKHSVQEVNDYQFVYSTVLCEDDFRVKYYPLYLFKDFNHLQISDIPNLGEVDFRTKKDISHITIAKNRPHRFEQPTVYQYIAEVEGKTILYLYLPQKNRLFHPNHEPITLTKGLYEARLMKNRTGYEVINHEYLNYSISKEGVRAYSIAKVAEYKLTINALPKKYKKATSNLFQKIFDSPVKNRKEKQTTFKVKLDCVGHEPFLPYFEIEIDNFTEDKLSNLFNCLIEVNHADYRDRQFMRHGEFIFFLFAKYLCQYHQFEWDTFKAFLLPGLLFAEIEEFFSHNHFRAAWKNPKSLLFQQIPTAVFQEAIEIALQKNQIKLIDQIKGIELYEIVMIRWETPPALRFIYLKNGLPNGEVLFFVSPESKDRKGHAIDEALATSFGVKRTSEQDFEFYYY